MFQGSEYYQWRKHQQENNAPPPPPSSFLPPPPPIPNDAPPLPPTEAPPPLPPDNDDCDMEGITLSRSKIVCVLVLRGPREVRKRQIQTNVLAGCLCMFISACCKATLARTRSYIIRLICGFNITFADDFTALPPPPPPHSSVPEAAKATSSHAATPDAPQRAADGSCP